MPKIALVSGKLPPHDKDGVGDYTALLAESLPEGSVKLVHAKLGGGLLAHLRTELKGIELVHIQHPSFGANPRQALIPFLVRLANPRAKIVTTMHEWANMHPLMRRAMVPLVAASKHLIFVSKIEQKRYLSSNVNKLLHKTSSYIPIGSNLEEPVLDANDLLEFRQTRILENGRWNRVVTHFGFIYESKQPEKMLEALQVAIQTQPRTKLLLVGDFFAHRMDRKTAFVEQIAAMGLTDNVEITGFIEDENEAARLLAASDGVLALYNDGLRFCRGSFWYTTQLGVPIITTAPQDVDEFAGSEEALASPHVTLVAPDASPAEIAAKINALPEYAPLRYPTITPPEWSSIAKEHEEVYKSLGV